MKISLYITDTSGKRLSFDGSYEMEYNNVDIVESQNHEGDVEADLINIHANVEYQTVGGIGGAFTDSCAGALSALSNDKKEEFIKAYFDPKEGINYNFGRLSIGSCDFSTEDYTYVDENDLDMSSFDISHDKNSVFPMVHSAMKYNDVTLFASPWSPPSYMKTSLSRIGGHLDKKYYSLYAKYLKTYIEEL